MVCILPTRFLSWINPSPQPFPHTRRLLLIPTNTATAGIPRGKLGEKVIWEGREYKVGDSGGLTGQVLGPEVPKDNFCSQTRFKLKLFNPKKCINCDQSGLATKQRKIETVWRMGEE